MMIRALVVVSLAAGAGCGKGAKTTSAADCGPLLVTVDGEPLALPFGLAHKQTMRSDESWVVNVFNMDKVTCDNVLSKSGRAIPTGEISVRASYGDGTMGKGVGISSYSQLGVATSLIGAVPQKAGDSLSVCVPKTELKPTNGEYKGKTIVVSGTFTGTYCGVMAF